GGLDGRPAAAGGAEHRDRRGARGADDRRVLGVSSAGDEHSLPRRVLRPALERPVTVAPATGVAGSGAAVGPHCVAEAGGAGGDALEGRQASLVLVSPPASLEPRAAAEQAAAAADGAAVAGMTSDGIITARGPLSDGCSALALDDSVD